MLLRSVDIENFRGIHRAHVELDDTTALIAENSAGKTTVLDALALCLGGRDDVVQFEPRDFRRDTGGTPADTLRICLTFEDTEDCLALPAWSSFAPFAATDGCNRRTIVIRFEATRVPGVEQVPAAWAFGPAGLPRELAGQAGLLAEWRRLGPLLRLRANRYVELDPRGPAAMPPGGLQPGEDSVSRQLEQQVRLVYDRLTGASDVLADELQRGLQAAETFLVASGRMRARPVPGAPRVAGDLAETPLRTGRRPADLLSTIKQGAGMRGLALVSLIGALLDARWRHSLAPDARPLVILEDVEAHLHPMTLSAMWELIATLPTQKIVTTNSGELLAAVPLRSIRRLVRQDGETRVYSVATERYSVDDLRRIAYHVRLNRAGALFARCWLLVEGETEAWLLPELAQVCGYDFPAEGIRCVEFAQCGIRPLLRLANDLGIQWHLLADGDQAGSAYAATATAHLNGREPEERVTMLADRDIEHCLYYNGYQQFYRSQAGPAPTERRGRRVRERATSVITRAIHARSKPALALGVVEAANAAGAPPVPAQLRSLVETCICLARAGTR
jgi:putative ATP-dependent endonuclease of OLD family